MSEIVKRNKQLDKIAKALTVLGYPLIREDETSKTFKVDFGVIRLEYGLQFISADWGE